MNPRSLYMLFALILLMASASTTLAQDAGMSELETIEEATAGESEKVVFIPGEELRYTPQSPEKIQAKDSLMLHMHDFPMQQATMKPAEETGGKKAAENAKDDSILTFNFLYYIIQKYKLQDIID